MEPAPRALWEVLDFIHTRGMNDSWGVEGKSREVMAEKMEIGLSVLQNRINRLKGAGWLGTDSKRRTGTSRMWLTETGKRVYVLGPGTRTARRPASKRSPPVTPKMKNCSGQSKPKLPNNRRKSKPRPPILVPKTQASPNGSRAVVSKRKTRSAPSRLEPDMADESPSGRVLQALWHGALTLSEVCLLANYRGLQICTNLVRETLHDLASEGKIRVVYRDEIGQPQRWGPIRFSGE